MYVKSYMPCKLQASNVEDARHDGSHRRPESRSHQFFDSSGGAVPITRREALKFSLVFSR